VSGVSHVLVIGMLADHGSSVTVIVEVGVSVGVIVVAAGVFVGVGVREGVCVGVGVPVDVGRGVGVYVGGNHWGGVGSSVSVGSADPVTGVAVGDLVAVVVGVAVGTLAFGFRISMETPIQ